MKKNKLIIFFLLIIEIILYSKEIPPEIGLILLYENSIEEVYRKNNFIEENLLVNTYLKKEVNNLIKNINKKDSEKIEYYFQKYIESFKTKNIEKIEKTYLEFKKSLYLLYNNFDIKGTAPELNFLLLDLKHLYNYIENSNYKDIILESDQIIYFIHLVQNKFIEKNIFFPEVKFLYNYFLRLLADVKAAALDKDKKTLNEKINLLEKLYTALKEAYETKKFNWNFDR